MDADGARNAANISNFLDDPLNVGRAYYQQFVYVVPKPQYWKKSYVSEMLSGKVEPFVYGELYEEVAAGDYLKVMSPEEYTRITTLVKDDPRTSDQD